MRLLLDTHIVAWAFLTPDRLASGVREAIAALDHDVFVSVASAWEMSIKRTLGKLDFPLERLQAEMRDMGFEPLPITLAHALAAGSLPRHHDDPFDRMLIAQARLEGLILVTQDKAIRHYDVPLFDNIAPGP